MKYIFINLLAVALVVSSCGSDSESEDGSANEEEGKIQSVEVVEPEQRSFKAEILITGTVNANQKVMLYAMESGYIKNIKKEIGDKVKKGELIATLENPQLSRSLEEKKARLKAKKSNFDRLKSVHDKTPSLTPLYLVEEAEAEYLSLKAEVSAIQDRLGFLKIKAPFTGIITQRMVDNGALIQSGLTEDNPQGVVEIQEVKTVRVVIPLPEPDVAGVHIGSEVEITFPELSGEPYNANVTRMAGVLDFASKTMQVEIDLDNADGNLKPGMYAKVLIETSSSEGVRSLPVTAQVIYQNAFFVLVVKNGIIERVPLRKGLSNKDYFEVLNPEITDNTLVVIQGKGLVKPGQEVKSVLKQK